MNGDQIFISHKSDDTKYALQLYYDLLDAGYRVWMDKTNLEAAEEWDTQIRDNIVKSRTFIVLFSSNSIGSE
jgi:TIR domain-containing protein